MLNQAEHYNSNRKLIDSLNMYKNYFSCSRCKEYNNRLTFTFPDDHLSVHKKPSESDIAMQKIKKIVSLLSLQLVYLDLHLNRDNHNLLKNYFLYDILITCSDKNLFICFEKSYRSSGC